MALVAATLLSFVTAQAQQSPTTGGVAGQSATNIAKTLENPIGDATSIPLQNNTNLGVGPHHAVQNTLNFQPVVPIHITQDWNLIVRTVMPMVWSPSALPAHSVPFGVSPTTVSLFLSPKNATDGWVWGVGPIVQVPTITNQTLGSNAWGIGPTAVIVKQAGPFVAGGLISNGFSLGGTAGPMATRYSLFTVKPFINYNFGDGWFIGTVPIITANWLAGGEKWTLPVGVQFGRVIKIGGKLPLNIEAGAYYNALRPPDAGTWQIRTQVAVIF
jgi:hypothetical protein